MEAVIGVDDLISRESLVEKMKHPEIEINDGQDYATCSEWCVKTAPTVDAKPVVHAQWIHGKQVLASTGEPTCYCSNCKASITEKEYAEFYWNACTVCTAIMDG